MIRPVDYKEEYFNWLVSRIANKNTKSYSMLLNKLYDYPFRPYVGTDDNRAKDGMDLRYYFSRDIVKDDIPRVILSQIDRCECSMLELMVALSLRIEEQMEDVQHGDRVPLWFWDMVDSLKLLKMTDDRYDEFIVDDILVNFNEGNYEPDGEGGLFTIRGIKRDMRDIDLWYQMCSYIDSIL